MLDSFHSITHSLFGDFPLLKVFNLGLPQPPGKQLGTSESVSLITKKLLRKNVSIVNTTTLVFFSQ